ncbi:MAG: HAD-IA family hydrolase, partial [Nanoarchaeota archaeon]
HMHTVKAFPGIISLVRKLHEDGYRIGIISSNSKKNVDIFLKTNKFPAFSIMHAGLGMFAKPRMLKRFAKHSLYIGDETRDIEAAHKANIPIIAVTWGYSSKDALKKHQPTALVDTTAQLSAAIRRIALKSTKV